MKPDSVPISVLCLWSVSGSCHLLSFPLPCPSTVHLLALASVPPQEHDLPQTMYWNGSFLSVPFTVSFKGVSSAGICCWNEQSGAVESLLCAKFCAGHCPCLPKVLVSWGRHVFFFVWLCQVFFVARGLLWLWFIGWVALWHVGS